MDNQRSFCINSLNVWYGGVMNITTVLFIIGVNAFAIAIIAWIACLVLDYKDLKKRLSKLENISKGKG